jgi:hypothetical protein
MPPADTSAQTTWNTNPDQSHDRLFKKLRSTPSPTFDKPMTDLGDEGYLTDAHAPRSVDAQPFPLDLERWTSVVNVSAAATACSAAKHPTRPDTPRMFQPDISPLRASVERFWQALKHVGVAAAGAAAHTAAPSDDLPHCKPRRAEVSAAVHVGDGARMGGCVTTAAATAKLLHAEDDLLAAAEYTAKAKQRFKAMMEGTVFYPAAHAGDDANHSDSDDGMVPEVSPEVFG